MEKHVLFFQGGAGQEDHKADEKMVASLQSHLGSGYFIHYPFLPEDDSPGFGRLQQIEHELSLRGESVLAVGHSLGASMLLKYLSETKITKTIAGVFLISTPFWSGEEDWVKPLKLQANFAGKLDKTIPLFFYHCQDDEVVPIEQFKRYQKHLPWATFRAIPSGGHQLEKGLKPIADDIQATP
ncbi:MAG: hypothetical protein K0R51_1120 [Cytophagaceae bacterium]|jgi:pimeloyl-ACP methyl ester carboxylesterase|nr:hypothetical protein [Cytophagaceae bacterium]